MADSKIAEDGPGNMAFGDTVELLGVFDHSLKQRNPAVTFEVFGSYVEVRFDFHDKVDFDDVDSCGEPYISKYNTDRNLSDEQEKYIRALAVLVAGMWWGWFPERIQDVQPDELTKSN